jgi:transposase InsO family protein
MEQWLSTTGIRVIRTPPCAPNCNAHAERFLRSIKFECLHRLIPLGERHLRHAIGEYVAHYHHERNHQGLDNELIVGIASPRRAGTVRRAQRLGGLLNFYHRAA